MKILLVEDDERIALPLAEALSDQQYVVDIASDGESGWDYLEASPYSLVVLDIMLPRLDGLQLCQRMRQQHMQTPVLMLTARDTCSDKVTGLDAGADDYVVKPFDLKELMARIRALLRRSTLHCSPVLEWRGVSLDPSSCQVTYQAHPLALTPKEYQLLALMMSHPHRTFSRSDMINHVWSVDETPGVETVKVHMRGLRQKLVAVGLAPDFIETVYGFGYRLKQDG
jgi:two-component system OmpR family response regulator